MKKRFRWKQLLAGVLAGLSLLPAVPQMVQAEDYWPDGMSAKSPSAIVMEVNTGTSLYEKKSHKQYYPASITKIMTTLLCLENASLTDTVTFSGIVITLFPIRLILILLYFSFYLLPDISKNFST